MIKRLKQWRQQRREKQFQNGYIQVYQAYRNGDLSPEVIDSLVGERIIPPFEKGVFVALAELESNNNLVAAPGRNQKGEPVDVTFSINSEPTLH